MVMMMVAKLLELVSKGNNATTFTNKLCTVLEKIHIQPMKVIGNFKGWRVSKAILSMKLNWNFQSALKGGSQQNTYG